MTSRMTYLVCRKAPDRPDGVIYFSGDWTLSRTRTSSIVVAHSRMFRREAWEGDETSARMIADIINGLGPNAGVPDAPKWEVLPAAIEMLRPDPRKEKAADILSLQKALLRAIHAAVTTDEQGIAPIAADDCVAALSALEDALEEGSRETALCDAVISILELMPLTSLNEGFALLSALISVSPDKFLKACEC